MLTKSKKEILEKLYYNLESGFTSATKLWLRARKENAGISKSDVTKYLSTQPAYARHKQVPKPRTSIWSRWIQVSYPGELVAIDIWYLGVGTKSQFPHALVAVDALSKYAAIAPIRNLTAINTANAMEKIINNFKFKVHSLYSDRGKEFTGKPFRDMMKEKGIEIVFTSGINPSKTALAESFIRSMRLILGRLVTSQQESGWNAVKHTLTIYNNSPHSSIGNIAPDSVTMENSGKVLQTIINKRRNILGKSSKPMAPPKFEIDDVVRILELNKQGAFDKINIPRWSKELYRVYKVLPTMPRPSYILSNPVNGAILPGSYSEKSLQLRHNV